MTARDPAHRSTDPVEVVDHDPAWRAEYERLAARALAAVGELAVGSEHVGSTAVPGLAAKPVVDLYVVVRSRADVPAAVERLAALGYRHEGDLGFPGREAFLWPAGERRHHLYVAAADNEILRRSLVFRDHLRAHPDDARAYEDLKRDLAAAHRRDRVAYGDGKTAFVERVLRAYPAPA